MFRNLVVGLLILNVRAKTSIDDADVGVVFKLQNDFAYPKFTFGLYDFKCPFVTNRMWAVFPGQIVVLFVVLDIRTKRADTDNDFLAFKKAKCARELEYR